MKTIFEIIFSFDIYLHKSLLSSYSHVQYSLLNYVQEKPHKYSKTAYNTSTLFFFSLFLSIISMLFSNSDAIYKIRQIIHSANVRLFPNSLKLKGHQYHLNIFKNVQCWLKVKGTAPKIGWKNQIMVTNVTIKIKLSNLAHSDIIFASFKDSSVSGNNLDDQRIQRE